MFFFILVMALTAAATCLTYHLVILLVVKFFCWTTYENLFLYAELNCSKFFVHFAFIEMFCKWIYVQHMLWKSDTHSKATLITLSNRSGDKGLINLALLTCIQTTFLFKLWNKQNGKTIVKFNKALSYVVCWWRRHVVKETTKQ